MEKMHSRYQDPDQQIFRPGIPSKQLCKGVETFAPCLALAQQKQE